MFQPDASKNNLMKNVARILQKNPKKYTSLNLISSAKVPIIRFIDIEFNLNFDISFNKIDGIYQVNEVLKSLKIYPEIKHLIFVLKIFLRQRDLNNTYMGGVGSFLLFCVILAFLRYYKREMIEKRGAEELKSVLLSEYLLKFLEFYGINFDCTRQKIIMGDNGRIVEKNSRDGAFSLLSPQFDSHDIGNAAFRIKEVFNCFKNRFYFLTNYNFAQGESILKYLINPSKKDFTIYLN